MAPLRLALFLAVALGLACSEDSAVTTASSASVGAGTGGAGGGGSDARRVCEAHCACEGCAGSWIDDCTNLREQNRPGCESEWDVLYACLVEQMTCNMGSFLTEGCGPEDTALRDCAMTTG